MRETEIGVSLVCPLSNGVFFVVFLLLSTVCNNPNALFPSFSLAMFKRPFFLLSLSPCFTLSQCLLIAEKEHVLEAIENALKNGTRVEEGGVGAGAGCIFYYTRAHIPCIHSHMPKKMALELKREVLALAQVCHNLCIFYYTHAHIPRTHSCMPKKWH